MINVLNFFSRKTEDNFVISERKLNPKFIVDEKNRAEYIRQGYTIIRKVVDNASIEKILQTYHDISKLPGYFISNKLETTPAFGETAHTMAVNVVNEISSKIFKNVLDENICRYDLGGSIIIKNKGCWLEPHQDSSVVDEYKNVTAYAWIPTVDMTSENGTFYAIAGSHLWAAWQRSSQHPHWPLKNHEHFLWKQMKPIFVNKGDILLFDSALIHASGDNKTDTIRVAFNACIIEKGAEHVQYVREKDTPKGMVEKFIVNDAYWHKGDFWGRPKGYKCIVEKKVYPETITKKFLMEQINKFNIKDN